MWCRVPISYHNTHATFTPAARKYNESSLYIMNQFAPGELTPPYLQQAGHWPPTSIPSVPEMQRKPGLPKPPARITLAVSTPVGGLGQFWSKPPNGRPSHCILASFTGWLCWAQTRFLSEKTKWEVQLWGCTKCPPVFQQRSKDLKQVVAWTA